MILQKIKQNLAGFAAVALVLAGFTALAPANAAPSALGDINNLSFTDQAQLSVTSTTGTGSISVANAGRGYLSARIAVSQAVANTLAGSTIVGSFALTGPNGLMNLNSEGFFQQNLIYHQSGAVVGQGPTNSTVSMVWPSGANSASTEILISAYNNNANFSFPTGNYSLALTLNKDGSALPLGSGVSISSMTIEYRVAGNVLSNTANASSWDSGFVCVDMAQVAVNDVLTVEKVTNGTASDSGLMIEWYRGGSSGSMSIAYFNNRSVVAQDLTDGFLAARVRVSLTPGQAAPLTMSVNIKKANGTDVSTSCGPTTAPPSAPTVAAAGSSATLTYSAGGFTRFVCALYNSSNVMVSSTTSSSLTGCSLSTQTSGTYTAKFAYAVYGVPGTFSPASSSFTLTVGGGGGGGGGTPQCPAAMTSVHVTATNITPSNSYSFYINNDPTMTNCSTPQITGGGTRVTLNGAVVGTPFYSPSVGFIFLATPPRTLASLLASPALTGRTINDGDVYTVSYYRNLSAAPTASDVPFTSYSLTLFPSGGVQNVAPQAQPNAPINSMPTEVPILRPTLGLSQGVRAGGTLVLEAANGATVTEVKVDGQAAALEKVPTGVEIVVPTGLTPGAKDLLIKTSTGSTLHVGAIKIADPVLEAQKLAVAKAAASVAFRAPLDLKVSGSNITSRQAAEVRSLVKEYRAAKEVVCVAVPATKASTAVARRAAVRACALFKAANRNLRVTVIVEAPSGAAANVISTELIG
jgi:hypothetical protein